MYVRHATHYCSPCPSHAHLFVQPTSAVRSVRKLQPFRQPLGPGGSDRGPVHLVLHNRAPRGPADTAGRDRHSPGRPNLPGSKPWGARLVTSNSDPAGRCHTGEAHLCQLRGLPFQPRKTGSKEAGERTHRGSGVHAGSGLHGSAARRLRLRLPLTPAVSVRKTRGLGFEEGSSRGRD